MPIQPKSLSLRHIFNFFILLPLIVFFYTNFASALNLPTFNATFLDYGVALALSVIFYIGAIKFRDRLYLKGEISFDTASFLADMLIFPFILLYPPIIPNVVGAVFLPMEASTLVASGIYAMVILALDRRGLPRLGKTTGFFSVIATILILAIVPVVLFVLNRYVNLGIVVSYLSITYLFGLGIYTFQTLVYRDKVRMKRFKFLF